MRFPTLFAVLMATVLTCCSALVQANIVTPINAKATSEYNEYLAATSLLAEADEHFVKPVPNDMTTWTVPEYDWQGWMSDGSPLPQWVWFDLGGTYDLLAIHIWNYYQSSAGYHERGAREIQVWRANSGGERLGLMASIIMPQEPTNIVPDRWFSLANAAGVEYVTLDILSNWGDPGYVGLSAVRFEPIPEPGTLALLSCGLVGLLTYVRRKRM